MKRQKRKYIQIRIPSKYKDIFKRNKDKIPQAIDMIFNQNIPIKKIDYPEIYDERITITIDELYYQKLEELAKKYKMKISTLLRNILLSRK